MIEKILPAATASPTCDAAANVAFDLAVKYNSNFSVFHVLGFPTRSFCHLVRDIITSEQESSYDQDYIERVKEKMKDTYAEQLKKAKKCSLNQNAQH